MQNKALEIIGGIYDAVLDDTLWRQTYRRFESALGGSGGSFYGFDPRDGQLLFCHADAVQPGTLEDYLTYYRHVSPLRPLYSEPANVGRVLTCTEFFGDSYGETEYCCDYLRRQGGRYPIGGSLVSSPERVLIVNTVRPLDAGPYNEAEKSFVASVFPHFRMAADLIARHQGLRATLSASLTALDGHGTAALFLDSEGRIIDANVRAQALFQDEDGVDVRGGNLAIRYDREADRQLQSLISRTIDTALGRGLAAGGGVLIARPSGRPPLSVTASPVRGVQRGPASYGGAVVLITITDPEAAPRLLEPELKRLYRLTPAETQLAMQLGEGRRAVDIAAELGIKHDTIRRRRRDLYAKLDVHRQAELVRLIQRLSIDPGR